MKKLRLKKVLIVSLTRLTLVNLKALIIYNCEYYQCIQVFSLLLEDIVFTYKSFFCKQEFSCFSLFYKKIDLL